MCTRSIILITGLLLAVSCGEAEKGKALKLAHSLPIEHPVHQGMEYMAKRLEELSSGQLTIQIYPSEQLGSEQQCVELVQIGSLAITKVSAAVMESFSEDYKVLGLPYLFKNNEHAFEVFNGEVGRELLLSTQDKLIRGLCFYDAGSRSFYTVKKPVLTPADLKGMKIRVMKSKMSIDMVQALGGSPTPISFGELYTALQSGVVDGAENNPPSFYTSRHYEVCKHYSLDEHSSVPDVLVMSTHVWNGLTPQEQQWLQQAADESVPIQRKLWKESVEESLAEVKKAGVTVHEPDKQAFEQEVQGIYESYRDNETIYNYIQRIKALK
jgi:tripartite ATP-independent transporter DctP family solute receptor